MRPSTPIHPRRRPRSVGVVLLLVALGGLAGSGAARAAGPTATLPAIVAPATGGPAAPRPAPAAGGTDARYFAETGHALMRGFLDFWQTHQGATVLGLPLTDEFTELYADSSTRTVQYFERGVLEYHPELPPGQQIVVRAVGPLLLGGRAIPPPPDGAAAYAVDPAFARYWAAAGGAAIFGDPISPALTEDGRLVQYFARTRLELHPEFAGSTSGVMPAPGGWLALRAAGYAVPVGALVLQEPPVVAEGHTLVVRVADVAPEQVSGSLDGQPLRFTAGAPLPAGGTPIATAAAVAGIPAMGAAGWHTLVLTVTDAAGQPRRETRAVQVVSAAFPTEHLQFDGQDATLLDTTVQGPEANLLNGIFAGRSAGPRWAGVWAAPLPGPLQITAPFGERRSYNGGPLTFHSGVDLAIAAGTPVRAAAAGRVVLARALAVHGNTIVLDHGLGVYSLYAHLSTFRVHVGDVVAAGRVLGLSGSTGLSTGPHLHWELHVSGPAVDPFEWTRRAMP